MRRFGVGLPDLFVAVLVAAVLVAWLIPPRKLSAEDAKAALSRELPSHEPAIVCRRLPDEGFVDAIGIAHFSGFDYAYIVHGQTYGRDVFVEVNTDSIVALAVP